MHSNCCDATCCLVHSLQMSLMCLLRHQMSPGLPASTRLSGHCSRAVLAVIFSVMPAAAHHRSRASSFDQGWQVFETELYSQCRHVSVDGVSGFNVTISSTTAHGELHLDCDQNMSSPQSIAVVCSLSTSQGHSSQTMQALLIQAPSLALKGMQHRPVFACTLLVYIEQALYRLPHCFGSALKQRMRSERFYKLWLANKANRLQEGANNPAHFIEVVHTTETRIKRANIGTWFTAQ